MVKPRPNLFVFFCYPTLHQLINKCGQHRKFWVLHTRAPERGLPQRPGASAGAHGRRSAGFHNSSARQQAPVFLGASSHRRQGHWRGPRAPEHGGPGGQDEGAERRLPQQLCASAATQVRRSAGARASKASSRRGARSTTVGEIADHPNLSSAERRRGFASTRKGDAFDCKKSTPQKVEMARRS